MAAANTYVSIATQTASGSVSTYTFSSIPSTYTDLVLIVNAGAAATDMYVRLNGDTATNYSQTWVEGRASGAISSRLSNRDAFNLDYEGFTTGAINVIATFQLMNYSNATTYKTALWREGNVATSVEAHVGLWRSTSAVTSLTVYAGGNFTSGSTFSLYGILAA